MLHLTQRADGKLKGPEILAQLLELQHKGKRSRLQEQLRETSIQKW